MLGVNLMEVGIATRASLLQIHPFPQMLSPLLLRQFDLSRPLGKSLPVLIGELVNTAVTAYPVSVVG